MTLKKRIFDLVCALGLSVLLAPLTLWVIALILVRDGRPIFYVSDRMKTPTQAFKLYKFRTMTVDKSDKGVSGGDKAHRITKTGQMLRAKRLDEIPQLWNILKGDISFVGPRPELKDYVDLKPELFAKVLKSRPGITGLATLAFHAREEALLEPCKTPEETEAVYVRRCLPVKARLDLIYGANQSICYDFQLMLATVFRRVPIR